MKANIWCIFISLNLLVGCGRDVNKTQIGAVLSLTGELSEYGKRCKDGVDLAAEELNAAGGVNNKRIEVVYEDDKGAPKEGVSAFQKLVSVNKVQVVIGAISSSVSLAIVPIATEKKVVLFSPASSSPKLSGASKFFFRNWPSDVLEGKAMALFAFDNLRLKRVAILWVNGDYGIGLMNEFKRNFELRGGKVVGDESYPQSATDFKTQLAKLGKGKPEAIYMAGYHKEMGPATKQLRELGSNAQILGDADYGVEDLLQIAGAAAEGAIYGTPAYDPNDPDTSMHGFVIRFRERFKRDPSVFEANGYDALRIIAVALGQEATSGEQLAAKISTIKNYKGVAGLTTFDENNDVVRPTKIRIVRKGEFVDY